MVSYNFKPDFAPAVRDGTKTLTMRAPRAGRSRHARVGDTLQLTTGARTKAYTVLATPTCVLRARVFLGPTGVVRVLDPASDNSVKALGVAMLLAQAEQGSPDAARWGDALAALDGFVDYAALYAWHRDNRRKGEDEALIERELIGWMA